MIKVLATVAVAWMALSIFFVGFVWPALVYTPPTEVGASRKD